MLKPNPINWIAIPATDIDRAVAFYGKVFDLTLEIVAPFGDKMAFLPMNPEGHGATGALSTGAMKPGEDGAVPYFGCAVDLQTALDRVEEAGGALVVPKTPIGEFGFIAQFRDSEGNRIGLHSET